MAGSEELTMASVSAVWAVLPPTPALPSSTIDHLSNISAKFGSASEKPECVANLLNIKLDKERWRCVVKDWNGLGLADTPGTGKLHHHLWLLS
jgi:hypothetical protein